MLFRSNGVNKTSQTNIINVFKTGQLHHVVITLTSAVTDDIKFNYSAAGSIASLYQYIGLYSDQFNSTKAIGHYDLYIRKQYQSLSDISLLTMTEDGVSVYNNDWLVIQNS